MTDFGEGDTVEITKIWRGTVANMDQWGGFALNVEERCYYFNTRDAANRGCEFQVKVLEKAKPAWWPLQDGDVFEFAGDALYPLRFVLGGEVYTAGGAVSSRPLSRYAPEACRLRFRDGKPWEDEKMVTAL